MRVANRRWAVALGAALVLAFCGYCAHADGFLKVPAWDDGDPVTLLVPSPNVIGVDHKGLANAANTIYFFPADPANPIFGPQRQAHVLSIGRGSGGYNPYWEIVLVFVPSDVDLGDSPITSADDLATSGYLDDSLDTGVILLCPQITK